MSSPPKHELYYSQYCKYSTTILQELNKAGMQQKFNYICIDKRFVKNNITYIQLPNGQHFPLPPMINRVPILLLKPKFEILSGNQILEYIKPQAKTIQEEKTMIYAEPNPFDLSRDTLRSSGVASDNYSFLDMEPNELAPEGNGGMRQMYSYATVTGESAISTPLLEGDKKSKMSYSMEDIEKMRNQEFPEEKRI
jgi:hypothetical protein